MVQQPAEYSWYHRTTPQNGDTGNQRKSQFHQYRGAAMGQTNCDNCCQDHRIPVPELSQHMKHIPMQKQFFADADRQHFKNQINDLVRTPHIRNGVIRFPQRTAAQKIHRRKQQPHISDRKNDQCHRNSSRKLPR